MHCPLKSILLVLATIVAGCGQHQEKGPGLFTFRDGVGRQLSLGHAPQRVISFAPSLTEMVYTIGGDDKLVGVTAWCDWPPSARSKPTVGDYANPNWERLTALKPDLVLLIGSADSPMLARLENLGIPTAVFRSESFEDIYGDLVILGAIFGRQAQAQALADSLHRLADSLASAVEALPASRKPKVFAEIADRPLMTGNDHSFLGRLIALAGGVNIAGDMHQDYAVINPEEVIAQKPDIILVLHPGTKAEELRNRIGWSSIPAVKQGRIVDGLDLNLLMRPGPRFPQAARILFEAFHGQK